VKRSRMIIGLVALAGFLYLGLSTFRESLNPYVSFAEARIAQGRTVQISGELLPVRPTWYSGEGSREFHFTMFETGTGDSLEVVYPGVKPSTFDEAPAVVVIGTYDGTVVRARQVLTKCPSRYEGRDPSGHSRPDSTAPPS